MVAAQSSGPSRRSHTKSRKGCKTCKRRHIRCDETYPQCKNCTKHQVRCDYQETASSDTDDQPSPEQADVVLTPTSDNHTELWQHLTTISNDLIGSGHSDLTILYNLPKFMQLAPVYPYVHHALLSLSANHIAWANGSTDARNLHIAHGGVALRGLHEAISSFSHENADAVLAASLLMLWQATDWRSWSSLRAGIQSVLSAMQSWKHESLLTEYVAQEGLVATAFRAHRRQQSRDSVQRGNTLQSLLRALQVVQVALAGQDLDLYWIGQLLTYVQRLLSLEAAKTPEGQFSQFYYVRKWLFWMPLSLLQRQTGQSPAMLTLSYFYATALVLDPLFPDLGSSFCSAQALRPLEACIRAMDATQSQCTSNDIAVLMQYPRQAAYNYRATQSFLPVLHQPNPAALPSDSWNYPTIGNVSPAFAPLTPAQYTGAAHFSPSSFQSPWLQVPGYESQTWGLASPALSPVSQSQAEQSYEYAGMSSFARSRGGWVPTPVWT